MKTTPITTVSSATMFHGCTITHLNITINKSKCVKLWALKTYKVMGSQVFVYMLTLKLLKLLHKPVSFMIHLIHEI